MHLYYHIELLWKANEYIFFFGKQTKKISCSNDVMNFFVYLLSSSFKNEEY